MSDTPNIFARRRSIRKFTTEKIPSEIINEILRDAMSAPSAMRRDPWEFIVFDEPQILADISAMLPHGAMLKDASHGIIVCGNINEAHMNELSYMLQDVTASVMSLLLSVEAHDLGACWLGVHPRMERVEAIADYFKIPSNIIPVAAIAIGFKDESKEPECRFSPEKIHFNRF